MNNSTVSSLHDFLALERPVRQERIPSEINSEYCEELLQQPSSCLVSGCESDARVLEKDDRYLVRCYAQSKHVDEVAKEERVRYRPDFEAVLTELADELGFSVSGYTSEELPKYALANTEEDIDLALLYAPNDQKETVTDILHRTIEQGRPCLLLTPQENVNPILELQSLYGTGYLAYALPFHKIADINRVRDTLQTIVELHDLNQQVVADRFGEDPNEFTLKADRNPRYILSELSQLKVLRANGEIRKGDGSRLEKISEAAFSHLFSVNPGFGGEDNVGEVEPDNLFYIQEDGSYGTTDYQPILGVVDTKSGKSANFAQEKVDGKHEQYVKRARKYCFQGAAIAHIFVVLDIQGQQEIGFYDRMEQHYDENMYMLVLTIDAFLAIMAAYLSATVSNELSLDAGSFTRAVYPLFHRETFNSIEYDHLRRITRDCGRSDEDQLEYDQAYAERSNLLVITRDVVLTHLREVVDDTGEIETMLNAYLQ